MPSRCVITIGRSNDALTDPMQVIDKNNKRLKGSKPTLTLTRHLFERVRAFWAEKKGIWCAVDFEAWELDHEVLTEFGWSSVRWNADGSTTEEAGHLINEAARTYINSVYLKDERHVSNIPYTFRCSLTQSLL